MAIALVVAASWCYEMANMGNSTDALIILAAVTLIRYKNHSNNVSE